MVVNVAGSDGPVLGLLNNLIRDLQMQLEHPITQENTTIILALITELENLREPFSAALAQEIRQHSLNQILSQNNTSTSQPQHQEEKETLHNTAMVVNVAGSDGPVLGLLNNRIRDLQMQLEHPITQENTTIILALITELENLREPVSAALAQEIRQHSLNQILSQNNTSTSQPQHQEEIVTSSGCATTLAATGRAPRFLSNKISLRNEQTPNVTSRLATRELETMYGNRRDHQFVYSRFRQKYSYFEYDLLTCITSIRGCYPFCVGVNDGNIRYINPIPRTGRQLNIDSYPLKLIQSFDSGDCKLLLASSSNDVKLIQSNTLSKKWLIISEFDGCKAARFSHSAMDVFSALPLKSSQPEILLYDIQAGGVLRNKFSDTCTTFRGQGPRYSPIHFSPCDSMLLWNGVLRDRRISRPVHRFDKITDCGGGDFHPAGNEVIINSEVLDIRMLRLLRSVPSLNETTITFNAGGDVIYAILRRDIDDVMSAVNSHRAKHPLYASFRTVDAKNYSDIATTSVDHCVLGFTAEPADLLVGMVTMLKKDGCEKDEAECEENDMYGCIKIYEIGIK